MFEMFPLLSSPDPRISDPPSFPNFPTHTDVTHFSAPVNGTFGAAHVIPMPLLQDSMHAEPSGGLPMTSDLPRPDFPAQVQLAGSVDQGGFMHHRGLPNGLGIAPPGLPELPSMPPAAASATPGPTPMEASSMPGVQTQGEAQVQPCNLLNSLPCEKLSPLLLQEFES